CHLSLTFSPCITQISCVCPLTKCNRFSPARVRRAPVNLIALASTGAVHSPGGALRIECRLLFRYRFLMENRDSKPCVITVAITGSLPRKENNPAVPITVSEQVESTHAAFEAGATVVHLHVRNDDQTTTSAPEKFAEFQERIRKLCPGIIVQIS